MLPILPNKLKLLIQQLQIIMLRVDIDDPENFQFASSVRKASKSITSNTRLLVIKGGHLYYYSNIPKTFNGNPKSLEYFHELPKGSIEIIKIKRIGIFEPNSTEFSLAFDEMFMMQREDIRKTLTNFDYNFAPKTGREEVFWKFQCQTAIIKQKWVSILLFLIEHYKNEEKKIEQYFQNLHGPNTEESHDSSESVSSRSTMKNPWRESSTQRKSNIAMDQNKRITDFSLSPPKNRNQPPLPSFKKKYTEVYKPIPNTFSNEVKMQAFEMSYQPQRREIDSGLADYPFKMPQQQLQEI